MHLSVYYINLKYTFWLPTEVSTLAKRKTTHILVQLSRKFQHILG